MLRQCRIANDQFDVALVFGRRQGQPEKLSFAQPLAMILEPDEMVATGTEMKYGSNLFLHRESR
jgi:hypothetical protein